jgi:excinuclease UvrABC ATPase subunit
MGPEGGNKGGRVMFEGTPEQAPHGQKHPHQPAPAGVGRTHIINN